MESNNESETSCLRIVAGCGLTVLAAFVVVFFLSKPFEYGSELPRPILAVTGALLFASFATFLGLINALKVSEFQRKNLLLVVLALAVSTRIVALFTCPILEIDYYRYLWDGKVLAENLSPYEFSPAAVLDGLTGGKTLPSEGVNLLNNATDAEFETGVNEQERLRRFDELSILSESNHTILNRIHYKELTTIYPPVSQFVFGLTMKWFPAEASVETHIFAIKFVLVLFDLATMAVVFWLLCLLKFHSGWLILYAWNPLVIKEVANGGHLDSIATLFLTLSVLAIVKFRLSSSGSTWNVIGGAVALGIGIGAKLSPAVLFPALAVMIARRSLTKAVLFTLTCFAVAVLSLWPMLDSSDFAGISSGSALAKQPLESEAQSENDIPVSSQNAVANNKDGLVAFFSKWRMNDPIFSTIYLNLKKQHQHDKNSPWFVVTSSQWRGRFCDWLKERQLGGDDPAFFATRVLTLGLFGVFYFWQLLRIYGAATFVPNGSVEDSRITDVSEPVTRLAGIMACFLVLQPTVNPWYFVWLAPLMCFTQNRGWALASGFLLLYYARFWFKTISGYYDFAGRSYSAVGLFDELIVFVEFGLILLLMVYMRRRRYQNS